MHLVSATELVGSPRGRKRRSCWAKRNSATHHGSSCRRSLKSSNKRRDSRSHPLVSCYPLIVTVDFGSVKSSDTRVGQSSAGHLASRPQSNLRSALRHDQATHRSSRSCCKLRSAEHTTFIRAQNSMMKVIGTAVSVAPRSTKCGIIWDLRGLCLGSRRRRRSRNGGSAAFCIAAPHSCTVDA